MKKFILLTLILLMFTSTNTYASNLELSGEGAILIDYDSGEVLFEKNSHLKLYPASTTKMMTAILAVENAKLDELVTVEQEVISLTKGSHIALEPGEILTMDQMLHALMLPSANDAALAIAMHVGGSVENFVRMMNEKARELGTLNTNFVNPNGLHDDRHVSTAYDLSLIGKYAMDNDIIRSIAAKTTYEIPPTNKKDQSRNLWVTNKLLFSNETIGINGKSIPIKYPGASGVKTGYTSHAGNCLVSYAERDGLRLIGVILKASGNNSVYSDSHKILNYGFDNYFKINVGIKDQFIGNIPILNGKTSYVAGILHGDIDYLSKKGAEMNVEKIIRIDENLAAPIATGQKIGIIEYISNDKVLAASYILATADIEELPIVPIYKKILNKWYLFIFLAMFLIRWVNLKRYQLKRRRLKQKRQVVPH